MFFGIAIGDALGAPVEIKTPEEIKRLHGRIENYKQPLEHKWFKNQTPGFWTDDTQLSLAVMNALTEAKDFDMDTIAKHHVMALETSTAGWGKTTVESIENLKNGIHWSKSGVSSNPHRGTGNGIPMKIAPLAIFGYLKGKDEYQKLVQFAAMTHYTQMSVYAGIENMLL